MKKSLVLLIFLSLLVGSQGFAQEVLTTTPRQLAMKSLEKIRLEISLTNNQEKKILVLLEESYRQIESDKENPNWIKKSLTSESQIIYLQLAKILTEEQFRTLRLRINELKMQRERYPEEVTYFSEPDLVLNF